MIYEPTGRAREYSELACNLYNGCLHRCTYCYVPMMPYVNLTDFENPAPKESALRRLEKDCKKLKGDPRWILFCFFCDPYPDPAHVEEITREALLIMEFYKLRVNVLTKGGLRAVRDFDILFRNRWRFGVSVNMAADRAKLYEPGAAPIGQRLESLQIATQKFKLDTWVSIEPVIFPKDALALIQLIKRRGLAREYKIGKINHIAQCNFSETLKALIKRVNWKWFLNDVREELRGHKYFIKKDLLEAAGE